MIIEVPVSIGEAIDKLTILDIKLDKIQDDRRGDVAKEYDMLSSRLGNMVTKYGTHYRILRQINLDIWDLQDRTRDIPHTDSAYGGLCEDILIQNDRRFRVKKKVNTLSASTLREQKGYAPKEAIFIGHLGLGDMINMVGAVRYLSTLYDRVSVACKEQYIGNMTQIYRDDLDICLVPYPDHINNMYPAISMRDIDYDDQGRKVYTSTIPMGATAKEIPHVFYDDAGIPRSAMREYFMYDMNLPKAKEIYDLVRDISYVFVHEDASTVTASITPDVPEATLIIDPTRNRYPEGHRYHDLADKMIGHTIPEYGLLLQGASEIHVIDSAFMCLVYQLDIDTRKVCYPRGDHTYTNVTEFEYVWPKSIMSNNTHVLIAMPCYQGQVQVETAKCVSNLRTVLAQKGIASEMLSIGSESLIPRGRNASTAYFLSKPFTHMLFIDADITFSPDSVLQLLARDEPISGCAYPKKMYNWKGVSTGVLRGMNWPLLRASILAGKSEKDIITEQVDTINHDAARIRAMEYVLNLKGGGTQMTDGWMEVAEIGTGFMMIKKEVIETLIKDNPDMKYHNDLAGYDDMHPNMKDNFYLFFDCRCEPYQDSQRYLSEDYAFCKLCAKSGYKIWLYANATLNHTGNHTFSGNLLATLHHNISDQARDKQ